MIVFRYHLGAMARLVVGVVFVIRLMPDHRREPVVKFADKFITRVAEHLEHVFADEDVYKRQGYHNNV